MPSLFFVPGFSERLDLWLNLENLLVEGKTRPD